MIQKIGIYAAVAPPVSPVLLQLQQPFSAGSVSNDANVRESLTEKTPVLREASGTSNAATPVSAAEDFLHGDLPLRAWESGPARVDPL